jgi:torulene dioxygenase
VCNPPPGVFAPNTQFDIVTNISIPFSGSRGEVFNYVLDPGSKLPEYKVFVIDTMGIGHILATITDAPAAYIHTLFSTSNYVILIVWQADQGSPEKPTFNILDSLKAWDPKRKTLFCRLIMIIYPAYFIDCLLFISSDVIDKVRGGVIAKYTTDTFFAFHEVRYSILPLTIRILTSPSR